MKFRLICSQMTHFKLFDLVEPIILIDANYHTCPVQYTCKFVLFFATPDRFIRCFICRLWRKSRMDNPGSACIGTDLNRNYDYDWNSN